MISDTWGLGEEATSAVCVALQGWLTHRTLLPQGLARLWGFLGGLGAGGKWGMLVL